MLTGSDNAESAAASLRNASQIPSGLIADLNAAEDAVHLVSATYFSGRELLYPDDRERLELFRPFVENLIEAARETWPGQWTVRSPDSLDSARRGRARRRAEHWVQFAKAQTCDRMGEEARANQFLRSLVTANVS